MSNPAFTMPDDSDSMPLDGDAPLTPDERKHLRRLLRDDDRATWARRQLRHLVWPAVTACVFAVWQAGQWVVNHVRVAP